jgi:hypothetical protein
MPGEMPGAGHLFAARGGMECFGRSLAGSINWAATPLEAGAMTSRELAPGCVAGSHDWAGARHRMWPSRSP